MLEHANIDISYVQELDGNESIVSYDYSSTPIGQIFQPIGDFSQCSEDDTNPLTSTVSKSTKIPTIVTMDRSYLPSYAYQKLPKKGQISRQ